LQTEFYSVAETSFHIKMTMGCSLRKYNDYPRDKGSIKFGYSCV